jgi:DNA helicase-2/ATP-dependent DNA helicase PcrA
MSYLKFIDNPDDIFSFRRCIQAPKRGIGKKSIDKIIEEAKSKPLLEALKSENQKINDFGNIISKARSLRHNAPDLIKFIISETGYDSFLKEKSKTNEELVNRVESIEQITNMSSKEAEDKSLQSLLDYMSLRADNASTDEDNAVRLSTIHSAKGLEFDTVFLIGMNHGIFPHESLDTEIEEARRLFYVAITRAKSKLYITHTTSSVKYGSIIFNKPSLFLSELPKEGINKNGGFYDFSNQW